jgi:ABC-type transport system substrate-binding protein
VVLTLRQPSASLLNNLTRFLIEPVHIPQGQELREPVGLGPFTHVKTERDVSVEVRKNPDYFEKDAQGRQLPFLDGVKIFRIFDRTLWLSAMRTGRIRLGGGTETPAIQTNVEALRKDVPGIVLDDWPTPAHGPRFKYIPPFTDPRVIEAISLWTDRKAIVDISGGGSYLSTTAIPAEFGGRWALPIEETTNWPGYRYVDSTGKLVTALEEIKAKWKELRKDPRDLERAKQLLAEAGIRQGQVSMEMLVPTFAISLYAPPFLSEMKTLFGATWSQRNDPGGGRGAVDVQEGRFQLMWGSGMTFDPDEPFSAFSSDLIGSGVVGLGNADPTRLGWPAEHPGLVKVRRLFDEQDKTLDVVKRRELIWELQRAILNSGYYVVLMDPVGWSAYWPEVRGTNDMYGCCGIAPFGWVTEQVWLRQ